MWLVWSYAEVANKPEWKGLTWGMVRLVIVSIQEYLWLLEPKQFLVCVSVVTSICWSADSVYVAFLLQ